jgi:hypothetical protein
MEEESSTDMTDTAPVGAEAVAATTISLPEKPVTKMANKPENYSPYGKNQWRSNIANDLKQREERERVTSPAGRALKTLKRLFSK